MRTDNNTHIVGYNTHITRNNSKNESSDYSYSLNFDDDDLMLNLFQITEILSYLKSESFKVYKNKELTSISVSDLNKPMAVFIF